MEDKQASTGHVTLEASDLNSSTKRYLQWGGWAASVTACADFEDLNREDPSAIALLRTLDALDDVKSVQELQETWTRCAFTGTDLNKLCSPRLDELCFSLTGMIPHASYSGVLTIAASCSFELIVDRLVHSKRGSSMDVLRYLVGLDRSLSYDLMLVSATHAGNVAAAHMALDRGGDVHFDADRALSLAAVRGPADMVELLLDRGASLDSLKIGPQHPMEAYFLIPLPPPLSTATTNGLELDEKRPMSAVAAQNQSDQQLSQAEAKTQPEHPTILLHHVAVRNMLGFMELLLRRGVDPTLCLQVARSVKMAKVCLHYGADVTAENVLQQAVRSGSVALVRLLLDQGAPFSATELIVGSVLSSGSIELLELVLSRGLSLHPQNPLWLGDAVQSGNVALVQRLINMGFNAQEAANQVLRVAVFEQHIAMLVFLLELNLEVSEPCLPTLLRLAVSRRYVAVVRTLLRYAHVRERLPCTDRFGRDSLHLAVVTGDPVLVKLLLENGADPKANQPALLMEACRQTGNQRLHILALLIAWGADKRVAEEHLGHQFCVRYKHLRPPHLRPQNCCLRACDSDD